MARRKGAGLPPRKRGRDIYEGLPTDAAYKQTAHKRAVRGTIKAWIIRLLVLGLIAVGVWQFGDDIMRMARVQAHQTEGELDRVGNHIREGRDRRAGVDWVEGE